MKNYNKILKAVNRGIQLALDDFDDEEQVQNIKSKQVQNRDYTKEYLDLMKEVVDLGLQSGTLWCKYNLDVKSNQLNTPEDWYGGYYAWGELEGNKPIYNWSNYKFGKNYNKLTKYCKYSKYGLNGFTDNLIELLPEDDAAYQNNQLYNFKFHMPTKKQFDELIYYTVHGEIKNYNGIKGLNGYRFVNNVKGNMVTLFIPYAGYCHNNEIVNSDEQGWYWSSTLCQTNNTSYSAHCLYFDSYRCCDVGSTGRANGLTIRPVINL